MTMAFMDGTSQLLQKFAIMQDTALRSRLNVAIFEKANSILDNEVIPADESEAKAILGRFVLAREAVDNSQQHVEAFARQCAINPTAASKSEFGFVVDAKGQTLEQVGVDTKGIPDSDLQFIVSDRWNRVAGVE
jgi:hypothetical protein